MFQAQFAARCRLVLAVLLMVSLAHAQAPKPRRIAVFGSSVAFGTGDETNKEGYTGLLRAMLAPHGWEVFNQSRGGDSTITMAPRWSPPAGGAAGNTRYLMTVNPSYVVIALSLANEGIAEAGTAPEKDAIFKQYADGVRGFIDKARQNNITPVVTLVYPRSAYTPLDYEYVRKMNLLQNTWDVPSVNFLGALDDGTGRWADGFEFNDRHPNAMGHRELVTTFVPTLFEALEKGKPIPTRPANAGFARVRDGHSPLVFEPQEVMHPFALSLMVRAQGNGTVAAIRGSFLNVAKDEMKGAGNAQYHEITLDAGERIAANNEATIAIQDGRWVYKSAKGTSVVSATMADGQWHHLVLSHYTARGETLFYVDGKLAGKVAERLEPSYFIVGGPGVVPTMSAPAQADYKDVFIFRSALNADEVTALHDGKMLQASLEIYAPLNDAQFAIGAAIENRAQSMAVLKGGAETIVHMTETASSPK